MQHLWPDSGWKRVHYYEMVNKEEIRKRYLKAVLLCHPDKHVGASAAQKYLAEQIFKAVQVSIKIHSYSYLLYKDVPFKNLIYFNHNFRGNMMHTPGEMSILTYFLSSGGPLLLHFKSNWFRVQLAKAHLPKAHLEWLGRPLVPKPKTGDRIISTRWHGASAKGCEQAPAASQIADFINNLIRPGSSPSQPNPTWELSTQPNMTWELLS